MTNRFVPRYQQYSTEKLVSILAQRREYQREAVEAAECILAERQISADTYIDLLDRQEAMLQERAWKHARRAKKPLSACERSFILLFPVLGLFAGLIAYMHYEKNGYVLKAKQAGQAVFAGLLFWSAFLFFLSGNGF